MSWSEFLTRHAKGVSQGEIAKAAGVAPPTVSRWLSGKQGVNAMQAAAVARALKAPVLEAFVAAGFLTEMEARVRPAAAPNYDLLTNDELLELVRSRMTQEGGEHGGDTAATNGPDDESDGPVQLAPAAKPGSPEQSGEFNT